MSEDLDSHCGEYDTETDPSYDDHLALLTPPESIASDSFELEEIRTSPLFSMPVKRHVMESIAANIDPYPQYGLLAGRSKQSSLGRSEIMTEYSDPRGRSDQDPRIFLNVGAPWSAFICGSQGSGKSHSLSCILENCLMPNATAIELPNPLAGLVFHYDAFTSAVAGQPCEAAYLCSSGIDVTVLVSPSNLPRITSIYQSLPGLAANSIKVEPLLLQQIYLNVERLMTLMAVNSTEGQVPLYKQVIHQILREMGREPNLKPGIDYREFKRRIMAKDLTPAQLGPLSLRLDLLESFIATPSSKSARNAKGNDWTSSSGRLIVVDLSCPFVDADTACPLFDVCLGVFLEQRMDTGGIVALDEAHKVGNIIESEDMSPSLICVSVKVHERLIRSAKAHRLLDHGCASPKAPRLSCRRRHPRALHISETPRSLFVYSNSSFHVSRLVQSPEDSSGGRLGGSIRENRK